MKKVLKYILIASSLVLGATSCEQFLDRPSEDSFTTAQFYQNDAQMEQGINYLYNSPWYDVIRFYIYGSETMCGNVYQGQNAYSTLTVNGTDSDLKNMAYSLWAVNAQCNTVINNILNSTGSASQEVINRCIGEALAWKAMTYFFLVRTFGDVPIIHDNTQVIKEASYNEVTKVQKADVYEYIVMTLEKAMELLPKNAYIGKLNRIDYYAAEALLAKVYLTKAGVSGTLNQKDLENAVRYAKDVVENSGRTLTPKYSDIFRMKPEQFQQTGEELFTWHWQAQQETWTSQNSIQCDVGLVGFDENGNLWGDWKGPSIDLQEAFGVTAIDNPATRVNNDDRRQATIMLFGDQYDYFWTDKGGFDFYRFFYDPDYCPGGLTANASSKQFGCATGANYAKHLYGDKADHVAAFGYPSFGMYNALPTHILRLGDIYLVLAEAAFLSGDSDTALTYVNRVRNRAHAEPLDAVDYDAIWKERRLELALEGDRWYDYVRRSYYDMDACIADLLGQHRSTWGSNGGNYDSVCKKFVTDDQGNYTGPGAHDWDASELFYNATEELTNVVPSMFTIPFPTEDVVMNPAVGSTAEAVHVDVRETYSYDF
ncbi:MAG: RagB/SusD family nutrient uptake outer membrane protein [Bacteroidales bacterium]|nr:RagB/SusD family nutrient uptake outer membrane protein [Bacteroidales bacterium]